MQSTEQILASTPGNSQLPSTSQTPSRVLVVEPHPTLSTVLVQRLRQDGHLAAAVGSAMEAVDLCREQSPDLLVSAEILEQNTNIDTVFITVGGGGLISGISSYIKSINPDIKVIGCSPINSSIMINSIKEGKIVNTESKDTLSDGSAGGVEEGSITFNMCKELIDDFCLVSEEEIALQIKNTLKIDKMSIEGSAAVAIASAIKMKSHIENKNVAIIICGGNIGSDTLNKIL